MATTKLMTTVLPFSVGATAPFHVSLFFAHRLEGGGTLSDYQPMVNWVNTLTQHATSFSLRTDTSADPIPCTLQLQDASADAWKAAFPGGTKVRDYPTPTVSTDGWKSFPANRMPDHAIDAHHLAVCGCPVSRPSVTSSPLARQVLEVFSTVQGLTDLIADLQSYDADRITYLLGLNDARDQASRDALTPARPRPGQIPHDPAIAAPDIRSAAPPSPRKSAIEMMFDHPDADSKITQHLDGFVDGSRPADTATEKMLRDVHTAQRYYYRPEEQSAPDAPRLAAAAEPPRESPDFHERAASVGNVRALLRTLGLVVDVVVAAADLPKLVGAQRISCEVNIAGTETYASPVTLCHAEGDRFLPVAADPDRWNGGRLRIGDEQRYRVVDLDPDAAGLALEQLLRSVIRALAIEANGDRGSFSPAGLRSTGFAVAEIDRPTRLQKQVIAAQDVQRDAEQAGVAQPEFNYEGLLRGIRVEVWDDLTHRWHSLHDRTVSAALAGKQVLKPGTRDLGVLQNPPMNRVPGSESNPYYVHEVLAGWDGWSLSAPRPGKLVIPNPSDDEGESPVPAEEPGLEVTSQVAPNTLPALRYGRRYAFRIAGVDLAGNSVPMDGGTAVTPAAAAIQAVSAHLDALRAGVEERDGATVVAALRNDDALRPPIADDRNDRRARIERAMTSVVEHASLTRTHPELDIEPEQFAQLGLGEDPKTASVPRPFLRWDPITTPVLVPRNAYTIGESLQRMVIRTGLTGTPGLCQRHVVPPKGSELEAEQDGRLDALMRAGNRARAYAIGLKERGSLLHKRIQDLNNPHGTITQPGIALLSQPNVTDPKTLDQVQDPNVQPAEGQYIVHDVDNLVVPYLPDPMAAGFSLVFYEAGTDHRFSDPRVLQSVSLNYPGTWPELQPFRIVLHDAPRLDARQCGNVIDIGLPRGEQVGVKLSTTLDDEHLKKMGLWVVNPVNDPNVPAADREVLADAARDGWLWWLTPDEDLRLVHATARPAVAPRISRLVAKPRSVNAATVNLDGVVDVHGASTDKVELRARWTDPVDDPNAAGPTTRTTAEVVVDHQIKETERYYLLTLDLDAQHVGTTRISEVDIRTAIHNLPDTRARRVTYRLHGSSRYREFFAPDELPPPDDPDSAGNEVEVNVPSSAVPALPVVHAIIPMFMWEQTTEPEHPFAIRRVRRSGVRIWLDRPWYSSGDGEMLAIITTGDPTLVGKTDNVSLWARDPVLVGAKIPNAHEVPVLLAWQQRAVQLRLEPESLPARPVAYAVKTGSPTTPGDRDKVVNAYGYVPEFHPGRKRWFVDVVLESTAAVWPFLRLAVARYQPNSLPGLEFSPVVATDFVQLPPERIGTLSRPDSEHVRVTVSGVTAVTNAPGIQLPAQPPDRAGFIDLLSKSRRVVATLQARSKTSSSDLDWESGEGVECSLSGVDTETFKATWTAELALVPPERLETPGASADLRVQIEEFEILSADEKPGQARLTAAERLVYADHFYL